MRAANALRFVPAGTARDMPPLVARVQTRSRSAYHKHEDAFQRRRREKEERRLLQQQRRREQARHEERHHGNAVML